MPAFLSPVFGAGAQLFNNQGIILAGGKIYSYAAGTTTPVATYTDSTATVPNANPIILDSAGRVPNEIWINANTPTKFILQDALSNVIGTWDNITGVNDTFIITPTITEWQATALTPAYVSPTSFTVSGNATSVFTLNRRVKATVTAGTVYGYVTASTYVAPSTTVVIQPDSTTLDTGLSAVSVGLLNSIGVSVPQQYIAQNAPVNVASAATTPIGAANSFNVAVTGTTTITAFDNVPAGVLRMVDFVSALTLTYNAVSMILPGAASISVAASDQAIFLSLGGGNWECLFYQLAALAPGVANTAATANFSNTTSLTPLDARYFNSLCNLTAAVNLNALTATLTAPLKLDFRSTTLGTGTPTSVSIAGNLTLTVPAGATLGTTNNTAARLVVLVVNNAGTPVLAITNLAGGLELDESNLVSPTTISAGATSANVIYSASAVGTNLAYRVIAYIDATEATAGLWATAPSRVQSVGGTALTDMTSLGYCQTWQNVTGSRALGTTYTNTTGRPLAVAIEVAITGSTATATYLSIGGIQVSWALESGTGTYNHGLFGIVPPGVTYSVTATSAALTTWSELF